MPCSDTDPCTVDTCTGGTCMHTPLDCDDGDACTNDGCVYGVCNHWPDLARCDDRNRCTDDLCVGGECSHVPNTATCFDDDPCTVTDVCSGGTCVGTPRDCDDLDPCTIDGCSAGACTHTPLHCDDDNACTLDTCANDACLNTPVNCDDADCCTADDCLPDVGCVFAAVDCPQGTMCSYSACACVPSSTCHFDYAIPPNCAIDARQPHPLTATAPRMGFDRILLHGACAGLAAGDFRIEVVPAIAPAPAIIDVTSAADFTTTLVFDGPIPTGCWTCITVMSNGQRSCVGSLPGDVNGSGATNAHDITALVNSLNGVPSHLRPLHATDIDHSGVANAQDITQLINLLNGAAAFDVWLGAGLPSCPSS
ncbi:MAG: hypothetical protein HY763_04215 [Planctomycetes bacterium]|nr:hypothetical protein [Planctomycetota bacterium]